MTGFSALALLACLCLWALPLLAQGALESSREPPHSHVVCSALHSRILARSVPYCVLLPPSYARDTGRRYPVAYFLHGFGDNQQALVNLDDSGIYDRLLAGKKIGEFVIIAPYGFTSFYVNSFNGKFRYQDFFFREFLSAMQKKYRIGDTTAQRGVMGISMGGYGALHYAFEYPGKFAVVSATMPATMNELPRELSGPAFKPSLGGVFGYPPDRAFMEANSPIHLAAMAPVAELRRLTIYFDCGAQDRFDFDRGTRELDALLTRRGVPHEAHIYPGGHNWQFVAQHIAASLEAQSRGLHAK
jgi:S-formylglutathione hydrolase FrmB